MIVTCLKKQSLHDIAQQVKKNNTTRPIAQLTHKMLLYLLVGVLLIYIMQHKHTDDIVLTCSHQCHRLVHRRLCHVLSCLCDNACKRSLAICCKSRASCPINRLLSVPIYRDRQSENVRPPKKII